MNALQSIIKRLRALVDKTALLMIIPCFITLWLIDRAMTITVVQWLLVAPIITGLAVIVSRMMFPQIELTRLIREAHEGNRASGIVVAGLLFFVGLLILSLVTWAKA